MLRLEGGGADCLIFLPGFMASPRSYTGLLAPLAGHGITVLVPQFYGRGFGALRGAADVRQEAAAAAELVRQQASGRVVLGGHSRGGQAAWLAAGLLTDEGLSVGLALVDPVDGRSRRPRAPVATARPAQFACRSLILGAGIAGPCAPDGVNHEQFARATPGAAHIVVTGLGHADVLSGGSRILGRRLCHGGRNPDAGRWIASQLLAGFVRGWVPTVGRHEGFQRVR